MAVPIKFGALKPTKEAARWVSSLLTCKASCTSRGRERRGYSREEGGWGGVEEVDEKMSCLRAAPGSLRGGAAQ